MVVLSTRPSLSFALTFVILNFAMTLVPLPSKSWPVQPVVTPRLAPALRIRRTEPPIADFSVTRAGTLATTGAGCDAGAGCVAGPATGGVGVAGAAGAAGGAAAARAIASWTCAAHFARWSV